MSVTLNDTEVDASIVVLEALVRLEASVTTGRVVVAGGGGGGVVEGGGVGATGPLEGPEEDCKLRA